MQTVSNTSVSMSNVKQSPAQNLEMENMHEGGSDNEKSPKQKNEGETPVEMNDIELEEEVKQQEIQSPDKEGFEEEEEEEKPVPHIQQEGDTLGDNRNPT